MLAAWGGITGGGMGLLVVGPGGGVEGACLGSEEEKEEEAGWQGAL